MHSARPRPLRAGARRFALGLKRVNRAAQALSEHRYQPLPGLVLSGSITKFPSPESTWRSSNAFGRRLRQMTHMRTGSESVLLTGDIPVRVVLHHRRQKVDGRAQIGNA